MSDKEDLQKLKKLDNMLQRNYGSVSITDDPIESDLITGVDQEVAIDEALEALMSLKKNFTLTFSTTDRLALEAYRAAYTILCGDEGGVKSFLGDVLKYLEIKDLTDRTKLLKALFWIEDDVVCKSIEEIKAEWFKYHIVESIELFKSHIKLLEEC